MLSKEHIKIIKTTISFRCKVEIENYRKFIQKGNQIPTSDIGFIVAHVTPIKNNELESYFTIWKKEDWKTSGFKYSLSFIDMEKDESDDECFKLLTSANNIQAISEQIQEHWLKFCTKSRDKS